MFGSGYPETPGLLLLLKILAGFLGFLRGRYR
jgi:hypothetical protein